MSVLLLLACATTTPPAEDPAPPAATPAAEEAPAPQVITAADFPGTEVTGIAFPTPAVEIDTWRQSADQAAMAAHAWGLWAGLTHTTEQVWEGQPLRVYETWPTKNQVQCTGKGDCPSAPRELHAPEQFHGDEGAFMVSVNYDPTGFAHLVDNKLYDPATLDALLVDGAQGAIEDFPATAFAIKPTYVVGKTSQPYLRLNTWSGPSDDAAGYGSSKWPECVWINLSDTTPSSTPAQPLSDLTTCQDAAYASALPEGKEANVVPLGDFVFFTVDETTAAASPSVEETDVAVLVAMHVGTREIDQWAWQTFWWSTAPDAPSVPSSAAIAAARPATLDTQASHYATCTAYQMLVPAQPYVGGDAAGGAPHHCFNPYLEAGFTNDSACSDLPASTSWAYEGTTYAPKLGVETNCMSCHLQASWTGSGRSVTVGSLEQNQSGTGCGGGPACEGDECGGLYTATRYVDGASSTFTDRVTLDALWSVGYIAQNNKDDGED